MHQNEDAFDESTIRQQQRDASDGPPDVNVLNSIIPRLWKTAPFAEPLLGLEVLDGPYVGVVFGFTKFELAPVKIEGGFIPAKFETEIYKSPAGFERDEAFDSYCSEVLLAWLHYIASHDLSMLKNMETKGVH